MDLISGIDELKHKQSLPYYKSGDKILDELLLGGFRQDLVYLLYGDGKIIVDIMINTMVLSFQGNNFSKRAVLVDMNNRFNPYKISILAAAVGLSPKTVLENIIISRAFTFEQMVEVLENRVFDLELVKILGVSGITTLWPNYDQNTFEGLLKSISGIKKTILKNNPLILLTAPLHKNSEFRPQGGRYLAHFGSVLVMINNKKRYIEYSLIQHPSMPEKTVKKMKPPPLKRNLKIPLKNLTLDQFLKNKSG